MTDNNNTPLGPQGTQMFDASDVNKMIAEQIISLQPEGASTPALIGISPNVSEQKYILDKDKLEVGRRPNSDISLNSSGVSSMHAHVIQQDGLWKVMNLLSSNGTYVNGEKITEAIIKPGDRVAFADSEFVFALVGDGMKSSKSNASKNNKGLLVFSLLAIGAGLIAGAYYWASM
jgi:pSer/pThr/pTyr-binding forkhead associated (FHA) protein